MLLLLAMAMSQFSRFEFIRIRIRAPLYCLQFYCMRSCNGLANVLREDETVTNTGLLARAYHSCLCICVDRSAAICAMRLCESCSTVTRDTRTLAEW